MAKRTQNLPARPNQDKKNGLPSEEINGRRYTKYDPSLALNIVERVANGELLVDICNPEKGMPVRTTFLNWVAREPTLAQAYAAAKELSAHAMEEEAISIARKARAQNLTTQQLRAAEIAIGQLRWSAERRDRKSFGAQSNAPIVVPIQINTTLDMGENAQTNAEIQDIYTIDVKPNVVESETFREMSLEEGRKRMGLQLDEKGKRILKPRLAMDEEINRDRLEKRKAKDRARLAQKYREEKEAKRAKSISDGNDPAESDIEYGDD